MRGTLSKLDRALLSVLVAGYLLTSLTLAGIPGWSRSAGIMALSIAGLVTFYGVNGRFVIRRWVAGPLLFVFGSLLWSLLAIDAALGTLGSVLAAWGGAILVALSVQNGVKPGVVLGSLVAASLVNSAAVALGFDAFAEFSADLSEVTEATLARRASGLVGNANVLAVYCVLPLFLMIYWKEHTNRAMWSIAIVSAAYAVAVTGSRQGLFLALMIFPSLFIATNSRMVRSSILLLGTLALWLLATLFWTGDLKGLPEFIEKLEVFSRIMDFMAGGDVSYVLRAALVEEGIDAFLRNPVFGHGLNGFRHVAGNGFYAHNNFIEMAVNGGVLLLFLFYRLHIAAFLSIHRRYPSIDGRRYVGWLVIIGLLGLDFATVSYYNKLVVLTLILMLSTTSRVSNSVGERCWDQG